jgi:hypothetical protein
LPSNTPITNVPITDTGTNADPDLDLELELELELDMDLNLVLDTGLPLAQDPAAAAKYPECSAPQEGPSQDGLEMPLGRPPGD